MASSIVSVQIKQDVYDRLSEDARYGSLEKAYKYSLIYSIPTLYMRQGFRWGSTPDKDTFASRKSVEVTTPSGNYRQLLEDACFIWRWSKKRTIAYFLDIYYDLLEKEVWDYTYMKGNLGSPSNREGLDRNGSLCLDFSRTWQGCNEKALPKTILREYILCDHPHFTPNYMPV